MAVAKLGTVWAVNAKLLNEDMRVIAYCLDTPNAIAKALMELKTAAYVKSNFKGLEPRHAYDSRMQDWNSAHSNLIMVKA